MNLTHPLEIVTPTLDGRLLEVLARGQRAWSGRELARAIESSPAGARLALRRLVGQGIVRRDQAAQTHLYTLNREHLAAQHVVALAGLRMELVSRLRAEIAAWPVQPSAAVLFGPVARGQADATSDLDLLVIFPDAAIEDRRWDEQIASMQMRASLWTGNDARVLTLFGSEADPDRVPVVAAAMVDGILLAGRMPGGRRRSSS